MDTEQKALVWSRTRRMRTELAIARKALENAQIHASVASLPNDHAIKRAHAAVLNAEQPKPEPLHIFKAWMVDDDETTRFESFRYTRKGAETALIAALQETYQVGLVNLEEWNAYYAKHFDNVARDFGIDKCEVKE